MGSITWPAVATVFIVAVMITVLVVTGHGNAVTMATAALGSVALALAHAFIAKGERAKASRQADEALRAAVDSARDRDEKP